MIVSMITQDIIQTYIKMPSVKCRIKQEEANMSHTSFIVSSSIRRSGKTASEASFSLHAEKIRTIDK